MEIDKPEDHTEEDKNSGESAPVGVQEITLLPFAVQVYNIFPIEITAKRFPVDIGDLALSPNINLNLQEPIINAEALRAQAVLDVQVGFSQEPHPFYISFKIAGLFTYEPQYETNKLRQFLKQGSLSVLLPAARQLLLDICIRLQIPAIVLPLVQLASPEITGQSNLQ